MLNAKCMDMMASCFIFLLQITWTILLVLVNIKMSKQQTITGFFVSNAANSSRQNIIKNKYRSALTVENLQKLLMIKIEGPDLMDFNFDISFETR